MKQEIRVVVFGTGFAREHLKLLQICEGVRPIRIVYSRDRDRATSLALDYGIQSVMSSSTSYDEMFEGANLAVVVSPPFAHERVAVEALRRDIAVICDKPMANTLASAERMAATSALSRAPAFVYYQWRYYWPFLKLRRLLQSAELGEVKFIAAEFHHGFLAETDPRWAWRHRWELAGAGAFGDLGVHLIDLVHWVLDAEMQVIHARGGVSCRRGDSDSMSGQTEDEGSVVFVVPGRGTTGVMTVSRCSRRRPVLSMDVIGERGKVGIVVDVETLQATWRGLGEGADVPPGEALPRFLSPYPHLLDIIACRRAAHDAPTFGNTLGVQRVFDDVAARIREQI